MVAESVDALQLNLGNDGLLIMNISLAVIMFGVALELGIQDFKDIAKNPKSTIVGFISQFLMLPFLTYLMVIIIQPAPSIALGMMMVAACPGGNISNFFSLLARGNAALSVSLTAIATSSAIIFTPLNFAFWASLYAPTNAILREVSLDIWEVFKIIVIILGIPLFLGMLFKNYKPIIAQKISPWIKGFGVIFFGGFVVITFYLNFEKFINYVQFVVLIVLIHNAIALYSGYGLAYLFKLNYKDRKSIAIETGIQNSGLGLILIFNFFDGLGGMALTAAWWAIWHIIMGLSLGWYWSVGKSALKKIFSNA